MSDFPGAIDIPTQHKGGWEFKPRYVIIHGTAGFTTAQQVGEYFQSNNPPTSVHYVVGQDGTVVQCVPESEPAWGNGVLSTGHDPWWSGNPNAVTFSIEHVKPHTDNSDHLTAAQQRSSFALVKHLCEKHGIPMRAADASGGITGHYSMDPVNRKFCPGPYPWDELWAYLNGEAPVSTNGVSVPAGWVDDGKVLTAPNKIPVTLGFRTFVLTHPWFSGDVPLAKERAVTGGTQQDFRYSILYWDNKTNTITEHDRLDILENELQQEQHAATTLSNELDDLTKKLSDAEGIIVSQQNEIATLKQQPPAPAPAQPVLTVAEATAALVVAIATELTISAGTK